MRIVALTTVCYFLAARLGLALLIEPEGVAAYWPASGVGVGLLIVLGRDSRWPIALGIVVGTVASNVLSDRTLLVALFKGVCNATEAIVIVWLIDRRFGPTFNLDTVDRVLSFLAAAMLGTAAAAVGGALTMYSLHSSAPLLGIWRAWFLSDVLGVAMLAPLVIGAAELKRSRLTQSELFEGFSALLVLGAISAYVFTKPPGSWTDLVQVTLLFPLLLWVAARCRPVFAAAAVFVVAIALVGATGSGLGRFGDTDLPLAERVMAGQAGMLVTAFCTLVLAALFAERRKSELVLTESNERLRLALGGAKLGAFSVDLETGRLECDARAAQIHGHATMPKTLRQGRRYVHPDDLLQVDAAFAQALRSDGAWSAEYRVYHPPGQPETDKVRWVAIDGAIVRNVGGRPVRMLGVTRDITEHRRAELELSERNAQLALAGKAALVGSYAHDVISGAMQVSPGYAEIYGLDEGSTQITREEWRSRVHPDDLIKLDAHRSRCFAARQREHLSEYRIYRSGREIRWIESRSLISYGLDGNAVRMVGVNIDVTDRRKAEDHKSMLIAELDHRVKNALTCVSVIAQNTRECSRSMEEFLDVLDGRIHSLANTHALLSRRRWQGVSVGDLVRSELAPCMEDCDARIEGPDVVLSTEATQALAMVLHELVTNATKYGALSVPHGQVSVRWRYRANGSAHHHLALEWRETAGPPVVVPSRYGYGSSVIRDLIPYELGGTVDLAFAPEGVRCRLHIPGEWVTGGTGNPATGRAGAGSREQRTARP